MNGHAKYLRTTVVEAGYFRKLSTVGARGNESLPTAVVVVAPPPREQQDKGRADLAKIRVSRTKLQRAGAVAVAKGMNRMPAAKHLD